jgi:hypothetical protein
LEDTPGNAAQDVTGEKHFNVLREEKNEYGA